MGWDPDTKDRYVDDGDNKSSAPLHPSDCLLILSDNRNPINDDLHQKLDLEDPEEEDEEEHRDPVNMSAFQLSAQGV